MRKLIAILFLTVLVGVPTFAQGTIHAFNPQPDPPAPLIRLSSSSPDKAPPKTPPKAPAQEGMNDPAQMFQQILQQLTQAN